MSRTLALSRGRTWRHWAKTWEMPETPMSNVYRFADYRRRKGVFCFTRGELNRLLSLYSRKVIAGDWKAYAIDLEGTRVRFSIFAHARARPLYTVIKDSQPTRRSPAYLVLEGDSKIAQGDSLSAALAVFERDLRLVSP